MQTSQVVGLHAYMPTCLHACSYYVTGVGKPATRGLAYRAHVCTCPGIQVPWCQVVQREVSWSYVRYCSPLQLKFSKHQRLFLPSEDARLQVASSLSSPRFIQRHRAPQGHRMSAWSLPSIIVMHLGCAGVPSDPPPIPPVTLTHQWHSEVWRPLI